MEPIGPAKPVEPVNTGYKPLLTVDVTGDTQDDMTSTGITPKTAKTPHVSTNIFVAGIPSSWDDAALRERYKEFGEIISTKVVTNRHFGFVMFRSPDAAHAAINATHLSKPLPTSTTLLHVSIAMHDEGVDEAPSDRIFVRGLPQWATKEHLQHRFSTFGTILECAVLMNQLGQCKGSGFVQFSSEAEATAAVRAENVQLENWSQTLQVKYSEAPAVRQQRQERNRNRHKHWANSPKYNNSGPMSSLNSPFPLYTPSMSMMPSPQGFTAVSPMPFSMMYPTPTPPSLPGMSPQPTQIIYPQPMVPPPSPGLPLYSSSSMVMLNTPPLPQKGDLHLSGGPLTEQLVHTLLQSYGVVDAIKTLENEGGIAVRMKDVSQHAFIAQQLNGTLFYTGQVLAAGLYA